MSGVIFALQNNRASHLTIYVDPKWILQGYIKGPSSPRKGINADLWEAFWMAVMARGGPQNVCIRKVDAHRTVEHVIKGEITFRDLLGNAAADAAARKGADLGEVDQQFVDQVAFVDARTWIIQKRIVQAFRDKLNLDKTCTLKVEGKMKKSKPAPPSRQSWVHKLNSLGHKIHFDGKWYKCELCLGAVGKKGLSQWARGEFCAAAAAAAASCAADGDQVAPSAGGSEPPKHALEDGLGRHRVSNPRSSNSAFQ